MRQKVGRLPPPSDADVAAVRLRTPLVRLSALDGLPVLVVDLEGRDDDVVDTFARLLDLARVAQRRAIVAESERATVARTAARWAVSPRSLWRWRQEARRRLLVVRRVPKTPPGVSRQP